MSIFLLHAAYIYTAVAADLPFVIAFVRGAVSAAMQLPRLARHVKNQAAPGLRSWAAWFFT